MSKIPLYPYNENQKYLCYDLNDRQFYFTAFESIVNAKADKNSASFLNRLRKLSPILIPIFIFIGNHYNKPYAKIASSQLNLSLLLAGFTILRMAGTILHHKVRKMMTERLHKAKFTPATATQQQIENILKEVKKHFRKTLSAIILLFILILYFVYEFLTHSNLLLYFFALILYSLVEFAMLSFELSAIKAVPAIEKNQLSRVVGE